MDKRRHEEKPEIPIGKQPEVRPPEKNEEEPLIPLKNQPEKEPMPHFEEG